MKTQAVYAQAGSVVSEVLGAIRTVASFGGEKQAIELYKHKLQPAVDYGIKRGFIAGAGSNSLTLKIS
jgi:ATP-binding cassette subfamily B (MDR/TAP) protein 1